MPTLTKISPLLILLTVLGCHSSRSTKNQEEDQKRHQSAKDEREMANLSSQYNAVTDWPQQLKGKIYSVDAEPILLRGDHRPLSFNALLEDIRHQDGVASLYFTTIPAAGEPSIRLILDCFRCNFQALQKSTDSIGDFGLIVQVAAVAKLLDGGDDSPDFVVHGKYIDGRFLGDYAMDKMLVRRRETQSSDR